MLGMLGTIVRKRNEAFLQIMENQALAWIPMLVF
jgi:hypothetical protein